MRRRRLGARGPEVSVIGFGAWAIGGRDWGPSDDRVSRDALRTALDEGVTFIDTADVYGFGHSEELIGQVLSERGDGDDIIVATKAGNDFYGAGPEDDHGYGPIRENADRSYLIEAAERSLTRLRVDALDLLQLHSQSTELLLRDDPWEALEALKRQGKIRHAGWSIKSFEETAQASILEAHADLVDVIQVRYNLLEREAEGRLFEIAQKHGIGVIVRIPLLFGLLTGKFARDSTFGEADHRRFNLSPEKLEGYLERLEEHRWLFEAYPDETEAQTALRFVLSNPHCHTVIPGTRTPAQARENAAAADAGLLRSAHCEALGLGRS